MNFIILLIAILIICVGLHLCYYHFNIPVVDFFMEVLDGAVVFITSAIISVLIGCIIVAVFNNFGYDAFVARKQQTYDSLVYQLENDLYDNDNDLGKKELYDQVRSYNETIASGKEWTHDLWFGIFWTDAYDELELIKLK